MSSTVPGVVACVGWEFALFPLTPALSPRERGNPFPIQEETGRLGFTKRLTTRLPLPQGEGRGEGEADARTRQHMVSG